MIASSKRRPPCGVRSPTPHDVDVGDDDRAFGGGGGVRIRIRETRAGVRLFLSSVVVAVCAVLNPFSLFTHTN